MSARGFLAAMAAASRARADALLPRADELCARAAARPPAPPLVLDAFDLVAEVKLASPAEGPLAAGDAAEVARRAVAYATAGAAAVSVLTEPTRFAGALEHLRAAAAALRPHGVPALRKDFLVHPLQVVEARAHDAGGVLVVARLVDDATLDALVRAADAHGMFVLLEAFDAADLERLDAALDRLANVTVPLFVGVNARDLATLQVEPERQARLAERLPAGLPAVAESGVRTPADAAAAARAGYALALVGTALMRSPEPARLAAALLAAGRAERRRAAAEARP